MFDNLKNKTIFANKYKTHSEAIIISCFFNPQNSAYRIAAFNYFYSSIKHLNHKIIECVIGDAKPQLPENKNIQRIYTDNLLWHKEALLNKIISELPKKYKYVFWVDVDVIFTNKNWLVEGVRRLQYVNLIQPFKYCIHLEKNELEPHDMENFGHEKTNCDRAITKLNQKVWRSFCSNYEYLDDCNDRGCEDKTHNHDRSANTNYDIHGHVGFAWGARREILDAVPLYDKALIGGGDHIIAHAAAGHIPHICIDKSFTDNLEEVYEWSRKFCINVRGKISYVPGDLYHIWHGDINKREYLKRIQDFTVRTKQITQKDDNGLYITHEGDEEYMRKYFKRREVTQEDNDGFLESMMLGYMTDSTLTGTILGGNPIGAMIGDMLNDRDTPPVDFGGGESGGGGAGGEWNNDAQPQDVPVNQPDSSNYDAAVVESTIVESNNFS